VELYPDTCPGIWISCLIWGLCVELLFPDSKFQCNIIITHPNHSSLPPSYIQPPWPLSYLVITLSYPSSPALPTPASLPIPIPIPDPNPLHHPTTTTRPLPPYALIATTKQATTQTPLPEQPHQGHIHTSSSSKITFRKKTSMRPPPFYFLLSVVLSTTLPPPSRKARIPNALKISIRHR